MVGRVHELDVLAEAFARATKEPGCKVITIVGPAGVPPGGGRARDRRRAAAGGDQQQHGVRDLAHPLVEPAREQLVAGLAQDGDRGVRLIERRPMPPLGHFSLIRFGKVADAVASAVVASAAS